MKHVEKLMAYDPKVRTERGVTLTVEIDSKALADLAMTATSLRLEYAQGSIKVSVKKPKR